MPLTVPFSGAWRTYTGGTVRVWSMDTSIREVRTQDYGSFYETLYFGENPPGGGVEHNYVWRWGFNLAQGGGAADGTKHAVGYEIESCWYQGGKGDQTEIHLAYVSKLDHTVRRLYSWCVQVDADTAYQYFQSGSYEFRDFSAGGGVNLMSLTPEKLSCAVPIQLANATPLKGTAAGGGAYSLIALSPEDTIAVGYGLQAAIEVDFPTGNLHIGCDAFDGAAKFQVASAHDNVDSITFEPMTGYTLRMGLRWLDTSHYYGLRLHGVDDSLFFSRNLSTNQGGSYSDILKVTDEMELFGAGKGLILKSPDGTKRVRISVSDAGAVVATIL